MFKKWLFFGAALLLQIVLLFLIIIPQWTILAYGREVVLETEPYDPYTIFSGYYARLNYTISDPKKVTGSKDLPDDSYCYVILKEDQNGLWHAIQMVQTLPARLNMGETVIRAKNKYWRIEYGIEQYYLPEDQRERVEKLLSNQETKVRVTVRLAADGRAAIQSLRIGKEVFKY